MCSAKHLFFEWPEFQRLSFWIPSHDIIFVTLLSHELTQNKILANRKCFTVYRQRNVLNINASDSLGVNATETCCVCPGSNVPSIPLLSCPDMTTKGAPEGWVNFSIPSSNALFLALRSNSHFRGLSLLLTKTVSCNYDKNYNIIFQ